MKKFFLLLLFFYSPLLWAKGLYLTQEDFLQHAFARSDIPLQKYWLDDADREALERILLRKFSALRVSYWRQAERTAWVFDEIGKTEPITIGVVVDGDHIEQVHILEFRETRGWEVKYDFFRDQFVGATLLEAQKLSNNIDNLTGATLSVNAVKKVAVAALYFHQRVMQADERAH